MIYPSFIMFFYGSLIYTYWPWAIGGGGGVFHDILFSLLCVN